MSEEILVNVTSREIRVAILDTGVLQEIHIERKEYRGIVGNIYKGRIIRLLPGIQAAFVDIGLERSAFLHLKNVVSDEESDISQLDIRDFLQVGKAVLVQVIKDQLGTKGARLTTHISFPSRYLVFVPGSKQISVSQKIINEEERERLLALISTEEGGYIFRTAARGISAADILNEKQFLTSLWKEIQDKSREIKPGHLVYEEISMLLRVIRDLAAYKTNRIRVDNAKAVTEMKLFAQRYVPHLVDRIEYYSNARPIFDIYSIEAELQKTLERKVLLKSGGYVVFDQTEAMTTIDVNTGSYLGHGNPEQTIFKTNLEAAETIARQVRLRNLGGIIIIDFIDMDNPLHKAKLLDLFKEALAKDNAYTEISELSSLGLVQMTRKRSRESIEHILCVPCPCCRRRGYIKSIETVVYEILREVKRLGELYQWPGFLVLASQGVIDCLIGENSNTLGEIEYQLSRPIQLRIEPSYNQEKYDILPLQEHSKSVDLITNG